MLSKADKKVMAKWKSILEKRQSEVAMLRDRIRDDVSEMESLADCCERAHEDIERAIDALSELA